MIFDRTAEEVNSWKDQMRQYEKGKRTKKPFGKSLPHVSRVKYEQVKQKEGKFNPLLQTYKHKDDQAKADTMQQMNRVKSLMNHIKNVQKYQKKYDIINLHTVQDGKSTEKQFNKKLGPIRNAYNVINNHKLPDFYFTNRDLQLPQERQKNLIDYHKKQFDIITGDYKQNNEIKQTKQRSQENEQIIKKYWKTHNYDPVFGKFYDASKQQEYQNQLHNQQKEHGKDCDKKYPPSYVYREPLILDFEKPLPQTLKTLDEKQYNRKKKYQMKYVVQDEYGQRNIQEEDKHERIIKNRVHDGRLLDEKAKEFDIITNKFHAQDRVQSLYGKKPKLQRWEEYIKPTDNQPKFIKTSGFN